MAVLIEFNDAEGDWARLEEVPDNMGEGRRMVEFISEREVWLTPALARRVAQALTEWADKEEGR